MRYRIAEFSETLTRREQVVELCDDIIQKLNDLPDREPIVLDFSLVKFITPSLISLIISLWKRVVGEEFGEKFMVLYNLAKDDKDIFHAALCYADSAMILANSCLELIGDMKGIDKKIWGYICSSNGVSSENISDALSISSIYVCNNKLRELRKKKLVMRMKNGRSYLYFPISPA